MNDAWKEFERQVAYKFDAITARLHTMGTGNRQLSGDVKMPPEWDWLHVECKRHKTLAVPAWVRQVETDLAESGRPDGDWLLVAKRWGLGDVDRSYAVTELGMAKRWLDAYRAAL